MKKTYEIFGLIIEVKDDEGSMIGTLKESCPYCGQTDCYFSCDQSTWDDELETEEDTENRKTHNNFIDGIEALLLALAVEGIDVSTEEFNKAIETAIKTTHVN